MSPGDGPARPCVIVIDDDASTCEFFVRILEAEGYSARTAANGREGIVLYQAVQPQLVFVDLRLPELSGLDVLRMLEPNRQRAEFIVISGSADIQSTVEAVRLGAADVVEKPLSAERLARMTRESIERTEGGMHLSTPVPHALRRWADAVIRLVDSPDDVRTLAEWGRFIGASRGALRNWCRTARLPSKSSLSIARMLRAVVHAQGSRTLPENLLNVVDRRTLSKLLWASGCPSPHLQQLPTVDDFLRRQRFISDRGAIAELANALRRGHKRIELSTAGR